jgi:hypothetical protein
MKNHLSLKRTAARITGIILLVFMLIFMTATHFNLHRDDSFDKNKNVDQWHQPIDVNKRYPTLISKHTWELEFTEIEKIINSLELNPNQEVLINSYTTEKLQLITSQLITSQLNQESENIEWDRLEFLIKKSLGNNNGEVVNNLAKSYYFYQKDRTSHLNDINNAESSKKLTLLKNSSSKLLKIQSNYFGINIAKTLFKRKNTTTNYLNLRKIVHMENGLSNTEKKEKLSLLSKNYKKSISQW